MRNYSYLLIVAAIMTFPFLSSAQDKNKAQGAKACEKINKVSDVNFKPVFKAAVAPRSQFQLLQKMAAFMSGSRVAFASFDGVKLHLAFSPISSQYQLLQLDKDSVVVLSGSGHIQKIDDSGKITLVDKKAKGVMGTSQPVTETVAITEAGTQQILIYKNGLPVTTIKDAALNPLQFEMSRLRFHPVLTMDPKVIWVGNSGNVVKRSEPMIGRDITSAAALNETTLALGTDRGEIILASSEEKDKILKTGGTGIFSILATPSAELIASDSSGKIYLFRRGQSEPSVVSSYRHASPTKNPMALHQGNILVATNIGQLVILDSNLQKQKEMSWGEGIRHVQPLSSGKLLVFTDNKVVMMNRKYDVQSTLLLNSKLAHQPVLLPTGDLLVTLDTGIYLLKMTEFDHCLKE